MKTEAFIERWLESGASERANKDMFLTELCDLLELPHPNVATGDPERDRYVFEADALKRHAGKANSVGKMDLYKEGCFIFEAKQGSDVKSKKRGTAKRGTPAWSQEMNAAYGQALGYAQTLEKPPIFLIACDIGHCFDLYACFDGSRQWRPFPTPQTSRIFLRDLAPQLETLKAIWSDPKSLDPSLHAAKVTREVAEHLAGLAKALEKDGFAGERIATFLMRCLFTMFAEDVGLLPDKLFQKALKEHWIPNASGFPGGLRALWSAMNEGSPFGFVGKLLRFNGGLFKEQDVLPLQQAHLKLLLEAAECDWSQVEPSIFGTLLERALDPKERHRLGAHYTPRAYVERLVRPTIEEPLREEWADVQLEVRALLKAEPPKSAKTAAQKQKDQEKREKQARELVRAFHKKLCSTRVLDPACGTGNFLYVTLDLFKRLEGEILQLLHDLGDTQTFLHLEQVSVTPKQFLGIEVKRWAKEIAELVLWIGYLQWNFKTRRKGEMPPEPILRDYHNIECRDALLEWDGEPQLALDEQGKPVTRWDGETYKKSPVTGDDIPDVAARVPVYTYKNTRKASWPEAEFIVGNPPFVGNKRMRLTLQDGYVDAVRGTHDDVPEAADYVMYWWNHAAGKVRKGSARGFGFITTNSITQVQNRKVISANMSAQPPLGIDFAIPDHPWVDSASGAAVRIAMTVATRQAHDGVLLRSIKETPEPDGSMTVLFESSKGVINSDLTIGADIANVARLVSNRGLACPGVQLSGQGFVLEHVEQAKLGTETRAALVRPYLTGRDLAQVPRGLFVIDSFGLSEKELKERYPDAFQWLLTHVKPERDQNPREKYRLDWWLHSEPRSRFRRALTLPRYIGTSRTARHRVFQFLPGNSLAETKVLVIALSEGWYFGVLSSRVHVVFSLAAGGWLSAFAKVMSPWQEWTGVVRVAS